MAEAVVSLVDWSGTCATTEREGHCDARRNFAPLICMPAASSARRLRATPTPADRSDEGAPFQGGPFGVRRADAGARELPPRALTSLTRIGQIDVRSRAKVMVAPNWRGYDDRT